jgi:serine/threonine protein kinase
MLVQCSNATCGTKFPRPDSDAGKIVSCPQCNKPTAAVAVKDDRLTGRSLGDYKLIRPIAKGGMGQVFEAHQTRLGRSVALKVLNTNLADDPMFIQRFEREAKAAAAISHPNIVHVYDFGQADGHAFLVMEFIDGEDLAKIVAQAGKMPLSDGLRIVGDVASALQEAYARGIIHRDIKPANILLTKKGVVKVSDLGLARRLDEDVELTATGAGIGTPHFMSPEQARDAHSVDHRADIYSLGITLLYLLTGKRPFDGKSSYSIVLAHSTEPLPSGLELGTELPANVETLIRHMAAKTPAERYSTYSELIADIRRVRRGEAPLGPGEGHTEPMAVDSTMFNLPRQTATAQAAAKPQSKGNRTLAIVAVVSVVALSVVLAFSLLRNGQNTPTTGTDKNAPGAPTTKNSASTDTAAKKGNDLTDDEVRALHDMLAGAQANGPGKRQGGVGGPMRGQFNDQLPPSPLPELPALGDLLKSGPVNEMLAEAEAYAKANPTNYRNIMVRYQEVLIKAQGTQYQRTAGEALKKWHEVRDAALEKKLIEFAAVVKRKIKEVGHREGMQYWRNFPDELRDDQNEEQIGSWIRQQFPPPAGEVPARTGAKGQFRNGPPNP